MLKRISLTTTELLCFTGLCSSLPSPSMASILSFSSLPKPNAIKTSSPPTLQTSTETLEEKFGRKGIKFSESNNVQFVELKVRNGSSLQLSLSDAHVVSYKPKVYWKDDGFEEVLYTVHGGESGKNRGGIGLVINDNDGSGLSAGSKGGSSSSSYSIISDSEWTVKDTDSDAIDALQVELSCTSGVLDMTYVVSLYPLSMATAVIVKNKGRKPVTLKPAIQSYLRFKKRSGSGIQGLKGCPYCPNPPLSSPFELLSPSEAMKAESSSWFGSEEGEKPGNWSVQDSAVTILEKKISRVYAAHPKERLKAIYNTPPSKYETIDQGRGLFFRIIRIGFEDMYVGSPGSLSERYGKDQYFVCTGPASMLVPVEVPPGEKWKGAQVIEHDNL